MAKFLSIRKSFRLKLIIVTILISLVPFGILGYFNLAIVKLNMEQNIYSQLQISTQGLAFDQERIIGGQIEKINSLSRIYGKKIMDGNFKEQEAILYSILKEASYLEEIYLVDKEGREMARASRRLVVGDSLRNLKDDPAVIQLLKGDIQWSQTFLDDYGQVRLKKVIPINNPLNGQCDGGMIIEMSLRRVIEQLAQHRSGQEGRIFVVNNNGHLIGHQDFSQVLKKTDVTKSLAVNQFISGKTIQFASALRYVSYDGEEVLGFLAPVKGLDWAVVHEVPVKIALASVYSLRDKLLLAGGFLVLLAITFSIIFGVRFSSSLNSFQQSLQQIIKGDLEGEVKVKGKDEFSQLANTLNNMRLELRTRRSQEEVLRQKERLTSLGLLASGVAHELNNPLGVIAAYSEDLLDLLAEEENGSVVTREEIKEYLQIINKQTGRSKEIIGNLLNFARRSSNESEEIDLKQIIDDTLKLVKYRVQKEKIILEIFIEDQLPKIIASTGEVQQVLLNVITNSLDALTTGGKLTISAVAKGKFSCLQIQDNGQGIAEEDLIKIYDPFFTTKEPGKGTGLGLSICYGIMEKLGGHIEIKSKPKEGTNVSLFFPVDIKKEINNSDRSKRTWE